MSTTARPTGTAADTMLALAGVGKRFGAITAVADIDLEVPRGSFVCFLGPSGCGKTTLLRVIAGLEEPSTGTVTLDGRDITRVPVHERDIGMVFQSLALFPHLDVAGNITYGMRIRGHDKAARRQVAEELLALVRLPNIAKRHISQLSGGQRQRVAIARALALEPKLFLLDEPLSALDAKLHEEMQVELKLLQHRVGVTTIMVTHDQREAMTVADIVVVMGDGRLQQVGTPLDIYRRPANRFVAGFIGSSNLLDGRLTAAGTVQIQGGELAVAHDGGRDGDVTVSVRPEDIRIMAGAVPGENHLAGTVTFIRDVGQSVEILVDCNGISITTHVPPRDRPEVAIGATATVELPRAACVVLRQ